MSERFWASGHWQVKRAKPRSSSSSGRNGSPEVVKMLRAFTMRDCFVR